VAAMDHFNLTWPNIQGGYALAGVALAALVYVVIAITRFMSLQLHAIERISTTLDNHLHDIADTLARVSVVLELLERRLDMRERRDEE
jgi:uncharacterized membrane protein YfbV (UPF0208 family)